MKTTEEINKEYGIKCAQLGDLYIRQQMIERDIERLHNELHNINLEAQKAHRKEQEQKPDVIHFGESAAEPKQLAAQ